MRVLQDGRCRASDSSTSFHMPAFSASLMFGSWTFHVTMSRSRLVTAARSKRETKPLTSTARPHPSNAALTFDPGICPALDQHPRDTDVDQGVTDDGIRPVDDDRSLGADHDVQRVQVHVEQPVAGATDGCRGEEVGRRDLVQPDVQLGQGPGLPTQCPRGRADRLDHGAALDALHDEVGAVLAHLVDGGDRIAMARAGTSWSAPRRSMDRAVARPPQDEPGPVLEDVGVPAGGKERTGRLHACEATRWRDPPRSTSRPKHRVLPNDGLPEQLPQRRRRHGFPRHADGATPAITTIDVSVSPRTARHPPRGSATAASRRN